MEKELKENNKVLEDEIIDQQTDVDLSQDESEAPVSEVDDSKDNLQHEISALKDQLLRSMAEMENIRRLSAKKVQEANDFAISSFARDLINVMENLHRATASISNEMLEINPLIKNINDGVEMTKKELTNVFERHGVRRILPNIGDVFDHNLHQAVMQVEDNSVSPDSITQVLQAGYTLKDRLLVPVMVCVAKNS